MSWYERLRFRLLISPFLVGLVGVGIMAVAISILMSRAPEVIHPQLVNLLTEPASIERVEAELVRWLRNGVGVSVLLAAVGAVSAGIFASTLLWRTIIQPLQDLATTSKRISDGRYSERVNTTTNSGEAMQILVENFNQMANSLEEVEGQRVALLGNIAHELRTPLTGLKGYLEGLLDGLFPANEETFSWMAQEVDRLSRLVNDIQHLSRVEAGQLTLELTDFALCPLIECILTQLHAQVQDKSLQLVADQPSYTVMVHGDADRTAQILLNLLGNAIRYTPENGEILVRVVVGERTAEVQIQDNGIGIPPGALPYIFERFYRVDSSRARASGGSGIGLTISRHLAWAMGGDITATSEGENKGSHFSLTLPLTQSLHTP